MILPRKVTVNDVEYDIRVVTFAGGYKARAYKQTNEGVGPTFYAEYETGEDYAHHMGSVVELLVYCVTEELKR